MRHFVSELDETYGRLSGELRRRIVTLKQRVVTQVNRIKALQSSIQEQVVEMKRLEVGVCYALPILSRAWLQKGDLSFMVSSAPAGRKHGGTLTGSDLLRQIPK